MDTFIAELETGLKEQLTSLADAIREEEEKILRNKEGYLKVQGALEILTVLKQKKVELENKEAQQQLTVAGVD